MESLSDPIKCLNPPLLICLEDVPIRLKQNSFSLIGFRNTLGERHVRGVKFTCNSVPPPSCLTDTASSSRATATPPGSSAWPFTRHRPSSAQNTLAAAQTAWPSPRCQKICADPQRRSTMIFRSWQGPSTSVQCTGTSPAKAMLPKSSLNFTTPPPPKSKINPAPESRTKILSICGNAENGPCCVTAARLMRQTNSSSPPSRASSVVCPKPFRQGFEAKSAAPRTSTGKKSSL